MTKQELNRDINRLLKDLQANCGAQSNDYHEFINGKARTEFLRLYRADENFKYMNKKSVLIMLRLNIVYRFVELHTFGLFIDLDNL